MRTYDNIFAIYTCYTGNKTLYLNHDRSNYESELISFTKINNFSDILRYWFGFW